MPNDRFLDREDCFFGCPVSFVRLGDVSVWLPKRHF